MTVMVLHQTCMTQSGP